MKKLHLLFALLLVGVVFVSCKKETLAHEDDFEKSYASWLSFKASSNNSYRYTAYNGSWTGATQQTVITVQQGKVVERSYELKIPEPGTNNLVVRDTWTEHENDLNTHFNGHASLTLDEVYQMAKTEWLIKRKGTGNYLETKNNGLISSCGYVNDNCQDDCFVGINITSIGKL